MRTMRGCSQEPFEPTNAGISRRSPSLGRHQRGAVTVGGLADWPTIELARMGEPGRDRKRVGVAPQERATGPPVRWPPLAKTDRQTARTRIGLSTDRPPAESRTARRRRQSVAHAARFQSTHFSNIGPVRFSFPQRAPYSWSSGGRSKSSGSQEAFRIESYEVGPSQSPRPRVMRRVYSTFEFQSGSADSRAARISR